MTSSERLAFSPADLREAWKRREFLLHYQPQVDLRTGSTTGAEALLRWLHPSRGLLLPGTLLPIAEGAGLIAELGEWALREACRQNRAWQKNGLGPIKVAVNVSALQLGPAFGETVRRALEEARLDPKHLELELTESVMFDDPGIFAMLGELRRTGVGFAIDDFGTGYSCLAHLKCCPITKLKVDKSFVDQLADDQRNRAIVQAVISLGHALGLRVVAEGLESAASLAVLRSLDCDEGQGVLFAKAMPAKELAAFLSSSASGTPCAASLLAKRSGSVPGA